MKQLSCLMCVVLLISVLSCPVSAQSVGDYYDQLSSDEFREAYVLLEEGIAAMAPVIYFPKELEIRYLDMLEIARAVCLDHPEYFWFLETWFYEYDSKDGRYLVDTFTPTYYLDNEKVSAGSQVLADAMIAFHSKVNEIIAGIPVNCTEDYEIALYLHDYLAEHVTYSLEGNHDSAYAALIHGEAACYGYSKAYQYLLRKAGIPSRIIVGDSPDAEGELIGHAWNQLWIDGKCFYTDVTWDDFEVGITHQYFMMSLDEISVDHIADERFALPSCDHKLDIYELCSGKGMGKISADTSGKDAAAFFRLESVEDREAVFVGNLRFAVDLDTWLDEYLLELLRALGLSANTDVSYYFFGDAYYLILREPYFRSVYAQAQAVALNVTEITLRGAGSQVYLIPEVTPFGAGVRTPVFSSDNEAVAVVDSMGMVTAVGPGCATVTVTSYDGKASASCMITVEAAPEHVHNLRRIPDYAATCTLDGNSSYYICTDCFHRFADEAANEEIADIAPYAKYATGHVTLSWLPRSNINSHQQVCDCGEVIPRTVGPHVDEDGNGSCELCEADIHVRTPEEGENPNEDSSKTGSPPYCLRRYITSPAQRHRQRMTEIGRSTASWEPVSGSSKTGIFTTVRDTVSFPSTGSTPS